MTASAFDPALYVDVDDVEQEKPKNYYRVVKFLGGEEILCGIAEDDLNWTVKKFITIWEPVVVDPGLKFRPWSELTDDYVQEISTTDIRSVNTVKEVVEDAYDRYCAEQYYAGLRDDLNNPDITEEEREHIEALLLEAYDGSEEVKEEDTAVNAYWTATSKTIH